MNETSIDVEACFYCGERPGVVVDQLGRHWCQVCADSSAYCLSCGMERSEYRRVVVAGVDRCELCARRAEKRAARKLVDLARLAVVAIRDPEKDF